MQSIQNAASVIIDSICSYLLYTEDVIRLKRTCKQFNQMDLYETSGHQHPHGVDVGGFEYQNTWHSHVYTYQDGRMHGRQYQFCIPMGVQPTEVDAQYINQLYDVKRDDLHGLHHQYELDENGKRYLARSMYFQNGYRVGQSLAFSPIGEITEVYTSSVSIRQCTVNGVNAFEIEEGGWESKSDHRRYTLRADGVLLSEGYHHRETRKGGGYKRVHYIPPEDAKRGQRLVVEGPYLCKVKEFLSKKERKRKMRDLLTIEEASGGLFETTCD